MALTEEKYSIRPAQRSDFDAIAALLVQLYEAELPNAIVGTSSDLARILKFSLTAKDCQGLQGRYVACSKTGEIIASITVERTGKEAFDRAPAGIIQQAFQSLGLRATCKLLLTVAKSIVPVPNPSSHDTAWVHSLIVAKAHRGQGLGKALMHHVETEMRQQDIAEIWLQVLAQNPAAIALYQTLNYETYWQSSQLQSKLTWPSYVLKKSIL